LFFQQVLLADDRNERAWLWMSEVADSPIERLACIERALAINPNNKTTQLALDALKAQLPAQIESDKALVVALPGTPAPALSHTDAFAIAAPRKPYRLNPAPATNGNGVINNSAAVHSQHTIAMPAMAVANGNGFALMPPVAPPPSAPLEKKTLLEELETVPLFPAVLFGTLSITAVTGTFLLLLLVAFT
jgi:hypothetical protein